jgi:flagella basal body P-ring formation protein FlgA
VKNRLLLAFVRRLVLGTGTVLAAAASAQGAGPAVGTAGLTSLQALLSREAASAAPRQARVEVLPGALDSRLRLAPCEQVEPFLPPGMRPWGRTRVGLRCVKGAPWQVYLPVTVRVLAPALVLVTPLPAGTELTREHLVSLEVDWAAESSPPFVEAPALVGRTLARPLAAGAAPRLGDLRTRQWFAAGENVNIVARGEGFSISGEGQALGHGLEGQSVRVRTEGGRVVTGRPVAERRLELPL